MGLSSGEGRFVSHEQDIDILHRQMRALRRQLTAVEDYVDTVSSPLWKRVLWWFEGFYFRRVGRWYAPNWRPKWPR